MIPRAQGKIFERALKFNADYVPALNNLAAVLSEHLDDLESAIGYMDRAVEIEPLDAKLRVSRGVLLARSGKRTKAIDDAVQALKIEASPDIKYRAAGVFAQTSKQVTTDAAKALKLVSEAAFEQPAKVLKMIPTDPDIGPVKDNPLLQKILRSLRELKEIASVKNRQEKQ